MSHAMKALQDNDHKKAHALLQELCAQSAVSDEYDLHFWAA